MLVTEKKLKFVAQCYMEKRKKNIFFIGLHNKPQGCGAAVASAAGPFTKKKLWDKQSLFRTEVIRKICRKWAIGRLPCNIRRFRKIPKSDY
jgi:hypothetical protein